MFAVYAGVNLADPLIYGMHDGRGKNYYQAECPACSLRNAGVTAELAVFNHFIHCSRKHSYVFQENYPIIVQPDDKNLQEVIKLAMLYGLPLPEYDVHDNCIRQMYQDTAVCVLHDMQGSWSIRGRVHFW